MLRAVISWSDNSNNEDRSYGFRIERGERNGRMFPERKSLGPFITIGNVPAGITSYTDLTIELGITYTYRIVAYNVIGEAASAEITGTSPDIPQTPNNLQLVFTWVS